MFQFSWGCADNLSLCELFILLTFLVIISIFSRNTHLSS
ncbi:hypothetical protein B6N60_02221 [Richelia sinica FACHB-800]|uniref:Uncharacterized protein n=1 Tax=Richelia sinica FACHB-800 TaxID=1357546 RepID=A0A975T8X0_9NOST|nr:hypothetical protein B6N60_02221 [Richelia sinica FACHB-800]